MTGGGIQHSGSRPSASNSLQVPRVGLVGLGVPLAAAGERGISRLGHMRRDAGPGQLLRDVPPAGAPLQRERHVVPAGEPRQPGTQVRPVGRGDLAALHLPGLGLEVVERDLFPVDVEPAYDGHRDLLKLHRGRDPPRANAYAVNRDASELRRSHAQTAAASAQPDPMHVIYMSVHTGIQAAHRTDSHGHRPQNRPTCANQQAEPSAPRAHPARANVRQGKADEPLSGGGYHPIPGISGVKECYSGTSNYDDRGTGAPLLAAKARHRRA